MSEREPAINAPTGREYTPEDLASIANAGDPETFWIGQQPEPEDRTQIDVSPTDAAAIRLAMRMAPQVIADVIVTNLRDGAIWNVRPASCGAACFCALDGEES